MSTSDWEGLLADLERYMSPDWMHHAREHGERGWIRLILLVDAQHQLATPRATEKVAQTMSELAVDREGERAGWEAILEAARAERVEVVARIVDVAPTVIPEDLLPLFARSAEPRSEMM